jgi:CheY-like chemotaxis protein
MLSVATEKMNTTTTNRRLPRVLVADDQDDVLAALELLLKNEGFDPDFAHTPADVVEAIRRRRYNLLLLDISYARDTTTTRATPPREPRGWN